MTTPLTEPVCTTGVWDSSMPGIAFDETGESNYARVQKKLMEDFPRGEKGLKMWKNYIEQIKKSGKGKPYDCVIGVSGGTDSSYLLHIAKSEGLRVLAVNVDNGFNSEIAVRNIKHVTEILDIDLFTWVIDYEEVKKVLVSYMKAGFPWIDNPTDQAIQAALFVTASREGVRYILNGTDFRSEGMQPVEWSYSDYRQLTYFLKRFNNATLKSYPALSTMKLAWYSRVRGIKKILPFNYLPYQKKSAQAFLEKEYGWSYYGGHHHENIFTKFAIGYWLPRKFGIDKRKITLSAQILSGEITREEALNILKQPFMDEKQAGELKEYVLKKLDLDHGTFEAIWKTPNRYYYEYPNHYSFLVKYKQVAEKIFGRTFTSRPKSFYQMEMRDKKLHRTAPDK